MEQFVNRNSVEDLKKRIVNCIKILNEEGVFELTYGHISCRIPNSDKFLILGHLHENNKNLFDVTEEDIVTMDIEGETLPGEDRDVIKRDVWFDQRKSGGECRQYRRDDDSDDEAGRLQIEFRRSV